MGYRFFANNSDQLRSDSGLIIITSSSRFSLENGGHQTPSILRKVIQHMKQRLTLLLAVMIVSLVSAAGVAATVSAKPAGNSDVRHYDLRLGSAVVGKLTVDLGNGHYVGDAKLAPSGRASGLNFRIQASNIRREVPPPGFIRFGSAPLDYSSLRVHWDGTLSKCDLDWITKWGDGATFSPVVG